MNIRYTERSKNEVQTAFDWYNKQRKGLGYEFLDCVEASLNNIEKFPEMYEECHSNFRRCIVRKFPYEIFYTIEESEIGILTSLPGRDFQLKAVGS